MRRAGPPQASSHRSASRGGTPMNGWTLLAALLAGGLLIYLVAVLLRPEDFS